MAPPAPAKPAPAAEVRSLAAALATGDWSAPVLKDPEAALELSRRAYDEGLLSYGQLATAALRWEAAADLGAAEGRLVPHPILSRRGELTKRAAGLFGVPTYWHPPYPWDHKVGLDEAGLASLSRLVAALPASERVFWSFPVPDRLLRGPRAAPWAEGFSVLQRSLLRRLLKPWDEPGAKERELLVVPSFGVLQSLLRARFGESAVELLPSFGPTSQAELMEGIRSGGRVLGLHFPGVEAPTTADGYEHGRILYSLHDFFHAYVASCLAPRWRWFAHRVYRLGEDYAAALARGEAPLRVIEGRFPVRHDPEEWAGTRRNLGDLFLSAFFYPQVSAAQAVWADFGGPVTHHGGTSAANFSALILRDLARHPDLWRAAGFEAEDILAGQDFLAREIFREAQKTPLAAGAGAW